MKIYRGDLKPDLRLTLTDDGLPMDLTNALGVEVIGVRNRTLIFQRPGTILNPDLGVVLMLWQAGDTAQVGNIELEVEIMWLGNKPQTVQVDEVVTVAQKYAS